MASAPFSKRTRISLSRVAWLAAFCGMSMSISLTVQNAESALLYSKDGEWRAFVEEFSPSCADLKALHPQVLRKGDTLFAVRLMDNETYFRVHGVRLRPGEPPEFWWWGAALEPARQQVCDDRQ